jgi:hypothetical protein
LAVVDLQVVDLQLSAVRLWELVADDKQEAAAERGHQWQPPAVVLQVLIGTLWERDSDDTPQAQLPVFLVAPLQEFSAGA